MLSQITKAVPFALPEDYQKVHKSYTARIYPSGDFSVGNAPPIKHRQKSPNPLDGITKDAFGTYFVNRDLEIDPDPEKLFKLAQAYQKAGNDDLAYRFGHAAGEAADREHERSHMGLVDARNCHKKPNRPRRGLKGLTSRNKRYIKSAYTLLEKRLGKKCLQWGCASLPPMPEHELELISANWAKICKKFFQEITRELERKGLCKDFLFVTEIQEGRFEKYGSVCLHLHWVCQSRPNAFTQDWAIDQHKITAIWERMLSNVLGREVNAKYATKVKVPNKSLQAELGKYMSKGGKLIKKIVSQGLERFLPTAYVGMSQALRKSVTEAIVTITGDKAYAFMDSLSDRQSKGLLEFRPILCEYEGREVVVGYTG